MGWKATVKALEAAQRRQQREAQKRQRELERLEKEQAKFSAMEQARLEVERFENALDVLLSVHKEQGETWNWESLAASLPPPRPQKGSYHEMRARQNCIVLEPTKQANSQASIDQARLHDDSDFDQSMTVYRDEMAEWEKINSFAKRVLSGDHKVYTELLSEFNPFAEISELGSAIHFTAHSPKLIECELKVNGKQAIPSEAKMLTSTGKLTVKPMSKGRFHEIYQDYLCGCVLRVAREILALLPVEIVLVNAFADWTEPSTGRTSEQAVLSVVMPRTAMADLNFDALDPSDTIESFQHRGHLKATRKSEMFQPILPLRSSEIVQNNIDELPTLQLLAAVKKTGEEMQSIITMLKECSPDPFAVAKSLP